MHKYSNKDINSLEDQGYTIVYSSYKVCNNNNYNNNNDDDKNK